MNSAVSVIIVAAGSGRRFGSELPKQFSILGGRPLLMTTIDCLRDCLPEARQVLVLGADYMDYWRELCKSYQFLSPEVVTGGSTRWESVKNALITLDNHGIIMVHDGARPFVSAEVTVRLIDALAAGHQGALPVISLVDSIRHINPDNFESTAVDRSHYVAVQTPQAFGASLLQKAYSLPFSESFTDDASVMEAAGFPDLLLVQGSADTFKITLPRDLMLAQAIIQQSDNAAT